MFEPLHQTVDRRATAGAIRQSISAPKETDEWLVSSLAPTDDGSTESCSCTGTLKPGLSVKIIYHDAIRRDARLYSLAREFSTAGALIRTTSGWMPSMVIIDKQLATLGADSADLSTGPTIIEESAIIAVLTGIFDQAWNAAIPLASSRQPESRDAARELPETERNLLKLLAVGMTDETVSRQLGISLRTTRRRIAALMNQLAASSRFQAGAEAAKRGWLS